MSAIDAKAAEEYVRAWWIRSELDHRESKTSDTLEYVISCGEQEFTYFCTDWCPTSAKAWLAAYEFTLQREEEIRLKREEIDWVHRRLGPSSITAVGRRILAVLESQLHDLTRGLKDHPNGK